MQELTLTYTDPVDQDLIKIRAKHLAGAALTPDEVGRLLSLAIELRLRFDAYIREASMGLNEGYQS